MGSIINLISKTYSYVRGGNTKVVNTILIGMYRTGTYTSIEMRMFRTSLNTDRIGHTGQFQAISTNTKKKKKKKAFFFFFSFVIFEFL